VSVCRLGRGPSYARAALTNKRMSKDIDGKDPTITAAWNLACKDKAAKIKKKIFVGSLHDKNG